MLSELFTEPEYKTRSWSNRINLQPVWSLLLLVTQLRNIVAEEWEL